MFLFIKKTLMNFHEPLEIKCNFQRPSSSDSPDKVTALWAFETQMPFQKYQGPPIVVKDEMGGKCKLLSKIIPPLCNYLI